MITFISDLDLRGSGYMNIAIAMCNELADRGFDVTVLGIGYKGDEHNFPFSIIPVETQQAFQHLHAMMSNLRSLASAGQFDHIDAFVVALDIPLQKKLLDFPRGDIPYMGIFPVESGPLTPSWANTIGKMNERLVISKYGHQQIEDAGLESTYLPVGIDTDSWRPPDPDERKEIRSSLGFDEQDFVVLTVADNQERKNLSAAALMMQELKEKIPIKWQLVTRIDSKVGWELSDYPFDLGAMLTTYERGLSFDRLWTLYAAADAFLLTSKAEGLCMPIVEAMAVGVPVVATECTAVPEHLYEDRSGWRPTMRGFPVDVAFSTIDPWGNSVRYFVSIEDGRKKLEKVYRLRERGKINPYIERGIEYARSRTWDRAGDVIETRLEKMIRRSKHDRAPTPQVQKVPPTLPQVVPRQGGSGE